MSVFQPFLHIKEIFEKNTRIIEETLIRKEYKRFMHIKRNKTSFAFKNKKHYYGEKERERER